MSQVATKLPYKVLDCSPAEFNRLAEWGRKEIELAENEMPGLMALREKYGQHEAADRRPHRRLPAHDHPDGRADRDARASSAPRSPGAAATSSRRRTTPPPPSPRPASRSTPGRARPNEEFDWCIEQTLFFPDGQPLNLILDDGGDLTAMVHDKYPRAARRHPRPVGRNDHRRPPPLPDARARRAEGARDQRQRLGHQEQVRQPLRLPRVAGRRHQAGDRHHDRRQGGRDRRLRRRRQGLRPLDAQPRRPRAHHRDRPDHRPAGGDGRLRSDHDGRRRRRRATSSSPPPAAATSSPASTCSRCRTTRSSATSATSTSRSTWPGSKAK